MAISKTYTAKTVWREAIRDLVGYEGEKQVLDLERFNIINRVSDQVVGMFYPLFKNQYITEQPFVADTGCAYSTATGTFVVATRVLAIAMNTSFVAADVNKMIMFRVAGVVYIGYIESVVTAGSVVLQVGSGIPIANVTVDYAMMAATVPTTDTIEISTLRIKPSGGEGDLVIHSTATRSIYAVDMEEFMTFVTTAAQNSTKIVYHVTNSKIYIKKGVASYGTITLYYPRLPVLVVADTDFIDVPEGLPTVLVISLVKKIVADRMNVKGAFNPADMQALVYDFWKSFDSTITLNEVKDKMKALT